MFKVTFRFENGETVEGFAAAEENLLEVARKTNVAIDAPCSGNGFLRKMSCETVKRNSEFAKNQTYYRGRICRGVEIVLCE